MAAPRVRRNGVDSKVKTFLKQGPDIHPSKATYSLLMRTFMGGIILAVVLLLIWAVYQ